MRRVVSEEVDDPAEDEPIRESKGSLEREAKRDEDEEAFVLVVLSA